MPSVFGAAFPGPNSHVGIALSEMDDASFDSEPYADFASTDLGGLRYPSLNRHQHHRHHRDHRTRQDNDYLSTIQNPLSSRKEKCRLHSEGLRKVNQKMKRRNMCFAKVLASLVLIFVLTVVPIFAMYPQLWTLFLDWFFAAGVLESPDSSVQCRMETIPGVVSDRCHRRSDVAGSRSAGEGACDWDASEAVCLVTEIKDNLDNRTKKLHEQVLQFRKKLQAAVNKNISDVYGSRPSIHLSLYRSFEVNEEHSKQLRWLGRRGTVQAHHMSAVRVDEESDVFKAIRVTHPGYYYVYCHMVLDTAAQLDLKSRTPLITVKVHPSKNNSDRLLTAYGHKETRMYFLQGVFLLYVNDTLSVSTGHRYNDSFSKEQSFFGAFRT